MHPGEGGRHPGARGHEEQAEHRADERERQHRPQDERHDDENEAGHCQRKAQQAVRGLPPGPAGERCPEDGVQAVMDACHASRRSSSQPPTASTATV